MGKYQAYPEYKDSGVEWLGKIPVQWQCIKLKYVASLEGRKTQDDLTAYKYVGLENIESWSGTYIQGEVIQPEGVSTTFNQEDVLFGKLRPYLAKSWLAAFSGICSSEFLVLRSKKVSPRFLNYYFLTEEVIKQVDSSTYGSKMPRASWDFIGLMDVSVPVYADSEKIASFLDHETAKIDTLINKQQQLIQLLKEKRQAVISHAVTKGLNPNAPMRDSGVEWLGEVPEHWVTGNLRWFIDIASGEGLSNTEIESIEDEGFEFRVVGGNGTMGFTKKANTTEQAFAVGRVGALCGNVHFIDEPCWITDNALKISSWVNFDNEYLYYLLTAARLNDYASRSAQPLITGEQVKALKCPIPPIHEQVEIGRHIQAELEKFEKLISKNERAMNIAKERRTALISAAVTGKIDVRHHASHPTGNDTSEVSA